MPNDDVTRLTALLTKLGDTPTINRPGGDDA